jgi:serine/threonine protein kinase
LECNNIIATEYINGENIGKGISEEKWNLSESIQIANDLIETISQIHEKGWVHGDINFWNILVTPDLKTTLIDFGSAFQPENAIFNIYEVLFPPPESLLVEGNFVDVNVDYMPDQNYDYWALGLVLYALFTGKEIPSTDLFILGETEGEENISLLESYKPYEYQENLPLEVNQLLANLLSHDPTQRKILDLD